MVRTQFKNNAKEKNPQTINEMKFAYVIYIKLCVKTMYSTKCISCSLNLHAFRAIRGLSNYLTLEASAKDPRLQSAMKFV